jgi:hypothetical protein
MGFKIGGAKITETFGFWGVVEKVFLLIIPMSTY